MRPAMAVTIALRLEIMMSPFSRMSVVARCQILFLDRKDRAGHDLDIVNDANAPGGIGEFGIVAPRRYAGDPQPLVGVDRTVLVVLALVGSPIGAARRRQIEFRDCIHRQIPES